MSEIVFESEEKQNVRDALRAAGWNGNDENLVCRVYRINGTRVGGGSQREEFIAGSSDLFSGMVPDVEHIAAEYGPGSYRLKVEDTATKSTKSAQIHIAGSPVVSLPGQNVTAPQIDLIAQIKMFKELAAVFAPQTAAPQIQFPDLTPIFSGMSEMMMKQQLNTMNMVQEMQGEFMRRMEDMRAEIEYEEIPDEEETAEEEGEEIDIESLSPLIGQFVPQLLGPGGEWIAKVIKGNEMFVKVQKNIDVLAKILESVKIDGNPPTAKDITKLVKILDLPAALIP